MTMSNHTPESTVCTDCEQHFPELTWYGGDHLCDSCLAVAISEVSTSDSELLSALRYTAQKRIHTATLALAHSNGQVSGAAAHASTIGAWSEVLHIIREAK